MAFQDLIIELDVTAISGDASQFLGEDETPDYDAVDSPGGYGSPNPARTDLAFYLTVDRYLEDVENEDLTSTVDNSNYQASQWYVPSSSGGWYALNLLVTQVWTALILFAKGDVCYRGGTYYVALRETIDDDPQVELDDWKEIDDLRDYEDHSSVINGRFNYIHTAYAEICYGEAVYIAAKEKCCSQCTDVDKFKEYVRLDVKLQAVFIECSNERYAQAAELLDDIAKICNDLTNCECYS